jgi:hypothetical protein
MLTKLLVALLLIPGTLASDTRAPVFKAPRIIMFYGGALGNERRYITERKELEQFLGSVADTASEDHSSPYGRPFVEIAMYWYDQVWEPYVADTALLKTLPRPRLSWMPSSPRRLGQNLSDEERVALVQPGRLYLATANSPLVFDAYYGLSYPPFKRVSAAGLDLLRKHGVPLKAGA